VTEPWVLSDSEVSLRPFRTTDRPALLEGRDELWERFLGPGHDEPAPTACIVVQGEIVGWVDADPDGPRLAAGEINLGYNVFAPHRGRGFAARAVLLMLKKLEDEGRYDVATLSVRRDNAASIAVARKAGFELSAATPDELMFVRPLVRQQAT
jgi:L-amino acid N-acyltransferase YncA